MNKDDDLPKISDLPTVTVDLSKCGTSLDDYIVSDLTYSGTSAALSTTLTGGLSWNNYPPTITSSPYLSVSDSYTSANTWTQSRTLKVEGDAEISGDLKLKGVNLSERLDAIEERLGILRPNNDLENKWETLKSLGEEYRRLERELLEGEKMWNMLKK